MLMENFTQQKVGCVRSLPGMSKGRDGTVLRDPDIVPGQPPIPGRYLRWERHVDAACHF